MRFAAPRSITPSPVRGKKISRSTFGLTAASDDESDEEPSSECADSDYDQETSEDAVEGNGVAVKTFKPTLSTRTATEIRQLEESVASIRLHARHQDPYEEWEKQTRKESFRTAQKKQKDTQEQIHHDQESKRVQEEERLVAVHAKELAEVQQILASFNLELQNYGHTLRDKAKKRNSLIVSRVEKSIQLEEGKLQAQLQVENQEREKKQKEDDMKKKLAEERTKAEQAAAKRKQDEEKANKEKLARAKEEVDRAKGEVERAKAQEDSIKAERERTQAELKSILGSATAFDDWRQARIDLIRLKMDPMKFVKSNKQVKTQWGTIRRQITSRISQLTHDPAVITRVSNELQQMISPPSGAHHPTLYNALLSSLSKAIILQAETEVTAKKESSEPLAQVCYNLLSTLSSFPSIFFAKLVQRLGGWLIPISLPGEDYDSRKWKDDAERYKMMGYRKSETNNDLESAGEHAIRVAAVMRVYFEVLKIPHVKGPLEPTFQTPRYWTWFARLLKEPKLLATVAAAEVIYTSLDVLGSTARDIWGIQFVKLLGVVYQGVTEGLGAKGEFHIGGTTPEGKAARVRVQLEIEAIMKDVVADPNARAPPAIIVSAPPPSQGGAPARAPGSLPTLGMPPPQRAVTPGIASAVMNSPFEGAGPFSGFSGSPFGVQINAIGASNPPPATNPLNVITTPLNVSNTMTNPLNPPSNPSNVSLNPLNPPANPLNPPTNPLNNQPANPLNPASNPLNATASPSGGGSVFGGGGTFGGTGFGGTGNSGGSVFGSGGFAGASGTGSVFGGAGTGSPFGGGGATGSTFGGSGGTGSAFGGSGSTGSAFGGSSFVGAFGRGSVPAFGGAAAAPGAPVFGKPAFS